MIPIYEISVITDHGIIDHEIMNHAIMDHGITFILMSFL